jgi:hypothetical protein
MQVRQIPCESGSFGERSTKTFWHQTQIVDPISCAVRLRPPRPLPAFNFINTFETIPRFPGRPAAHPAGQLTFRRFGAAAGLPNRTSPSGRKPLDKMSLSALISLM